jgi:pyroglutamyl-peptidase
VSFFNTRKSLLVAGFGAFPGQRTNPAELLTRRLERSKRVFALAGIDLHTAVLPVDRLALSPTLSRLFAETYPDAVLLLGVAARRKRLTIETLARNRASILKPDAAKQRPFCRFIVPAARTSCMARAPRPASLRWRAAMACPPRCPMTRAIIFAMKASISRC